ncbi:single-stranded-DNA-specific exonuclease RecJ [Fenollaria timonensis]|uniref:single-stranded-DNA-specific exonuclease RecJ n=1 Tax=Fenollaria timonensis TaxID=1723384 RepID=UPI0026EA1511|nr:single-stranded-DNA-specific exonuclease RecJ [Fenollaria timonensis]
MQKWFLKNRNAENYSAVKSIVKDDLLAKVLCNRGVVDADEVIDYLNDDYTKIYRTDGLPDMDVAREIIKDAIDNHKKIRVVGDYDSDGIMSTTLLLRSLKSFGAEASFEVPDRKADGYGINKRIVDGCIKDDVAVIITCDNGVSAFEAVKYAKDNGIKVIVTDHHLPKIEDGKEISVEADAIIDPKVEKSSYLFKEICGAFVAFKLITYISKDYDFNPDLIDEIIQYAAFATVTDIMPLLDENRDLVKRGLQLMDSRPAKVFYHLKNELKVDKEINVFHIGFILGPSVNAIGRLSNANHAIAAFESCDDDSIIAICKELYALNQERKDLTELGYDVAIKEIEADEAFEDKDIIIVKSKDIERSVAGIVAGRLKERYYKPAIALYEENGVLYGSARSIEEYNIFDELNKAKELLNSFGGHKLAAGLELKLDNYDDFVRFLNENSTLTDEDKIEKVYIDAFYPIDFQKFSTYDTIEKLKPFGEKNPAVLFADKDLVLKDISVFGQNRSVIKLKFRTKLDNIMMAILFYKEDEFKKDYEDQFNSDIYRDLASGKEIIMDICYNLRINEYMNNKNLEINIKHFRFRR